jgi:hypothetical protein
MPHLDWYQQFADRPAYPAGNHFRQSNRAKPFSHSVDAASEHEAKKKSNWAEPGSSTLDELQACSTIHDLSEILSTARGKWEEEQQF